MNVVRRATIALVTSILAFGGFAVVTSAVDTTANANTPSARDTTWP